MVKTLLFIPACLDLYNKLSNDYFSIHLGPAYIASFLEKNGHQVRLIDLQISDSSMEYISWIVKHEKPSFVGVTCLTPLINEAKRIAKIVKLSNPKIKVVLGGPHPSAVPKETLKDKNIDIVVIGEGEHTFLELVKGHDLNRIKGIAYKKNGRVVINPPRTQIKYLDSLPFPAYHLVDIKNYEGPMFYEERTAGIAGSRGCPYNCIFCAVSTIHREVRLRSSRNIIDEIEYLYRKYKFKSFILYDELFTVYKQRATAVCKEIKKRELNIQWACSSRVDTVDEKLLKLMKESGCEMISYGIESGNQKILDLIQKGVTIEQIEHAVSTADKVGLKVLGLFMLGHPYETENTIQETIDLAKRLPFYNVIFTIAMPLPGTGLWDFAREKKGLRLLTEDYSKFRSYGKPVIKLPSIPAEKLVKYQKKAYREFYLRLNYLIWRLSKTSIKFIWIDIKKSLSLLSFVR